MTTMQRVQRQGVLVNGIWYVHPLLAHLVGVTVEIRTESQDGRVEVCIPASPVRAAFATNLPAEGLTDMRETWMRNRIRRRRGGGPLPQERAS